MKRTWQKISLSYDYLLKQLTGCLLLWNTPALDLKKKQLSLSVQPVGHSEISGS
jgi:hypothetical protein